MELVGPVISFGALQEEWRMTSEYSGKGPIEPLSVKAGVPMNPLLSWILTGISGLTLVSVLGGIFAAGIWKGSIDTQLNAIADRQKQFLDEQKEARQKVEALQNTLSELKGQMASLPGTAPKAAPQR
jgi:hypothetical protein